MAAKPSLHEELRLIYDEHTIRRDESSSSLSRVLPGAYAGRGLLTRGECETLMREAIDRGMRHVEQGRRCGTSIKVKDDGSVTDARLRDCTRTELLHPELADKMFERLAAPRVGGDGRRLRWPTRSACRRATRCCTACGGCRASTR